jgi:hypothetical protein
MDFRKHFTVPTGFLYDRIAAGEVLRRAVIPPIHSHNLLHRFYGYQSRVALPPVLRLSVQGGPARTRGA